MTAETQKTLTGVLKWMAYLVVGLLSFIYGQNLADTTKKVDAVDMKVEANRSVLVQNGVRITKLETLQPEDRKLLEKLDAKIDKFDERSEEQGRILAAIADRLNVKAGKGGG